MMRQAITKNMVILSLFAIGTAATLAITNAFTIEQVECNRQQALQQSLAQVLPAALYDNDLLADHISVNAAPLGRDTQRIYRGRINGTVTSAVIESTAPDGYGGNIALIVGIDANGTVQGVRVVPPHNETPGLGDAIETRKSDWILSFNGLSLGNPSDDGWAVKKDGGQFDSFTGATITPRAIVNAVHRALQYWQTNRDAITLAPAEASPSQHCESHTAPEENHDE